MKKLVFVLLMIAHFCKGQSPFNTKLLQKEMEADRISESKGFQRFQSLQNNNSFTVATNNFNIHYTRCEWQVDPAIKYIRGKISFYFTITQSSNSITFDLYNQLITDSVLYHGNTISFQQTAANGLVINFPATISGNTKDSVSIFYQGVPDGSGFGSFTQSSHSGTSIIWTLSEPYGGRDWWPCKNGLNDKTDSIDIIITNPSAYTPSSNGLLIDETINGANKITHFKSNYPIATYLVAMAITNYQTTMDTIQVNGKPLLYVGNYYPETFSNFKTYESFAKECLVLYSKLFGDYPFLKEKYGQTQFGWGGGMEHQTNSFIGSRSPNLQAHELAHQWFGDMITCGSWQDIWLNEGFAVYLTHLFLEYNYPPFYKPLLLSTFSNVLSDSSGSVFVTDTANVGRLFSGRLTYNKGAYVLHMLRGIIGDSVFYRGVRRYASDAAVKYGYARTADLQRNLEQESGKNLNSFFQKWIYGEGYPNYHAEWTQNTNNWVKVKLDQSTSHPSVKFYDMPVNLLFRGASQDTTFKVDHQYNGQEFWINVGFPVDTVIIDPDLWILSKIKTSTKTAGSNTVNEIKVYPNPSPGTLYISLKNPSDKKLQIQLYNTIGQLVYQQQKDTPGRDELIGIPASRLSRGVYFLKLRSEKNIKMVKKIVR